MGGNGIPCIFVHVAPGSPQQKNKPSPHHDLDSLRKRLTVTALPVGKPTGSLQHHAARDRNERAGPTSGEMRPARSDSATGHLSRETSPSMRDRAWILGRSTRGAMPVYSSPRLRFGHGSPYQLRMASVKFIATTLASIPSGGHSPGLHD